MPPHLNESLYVGISNIELKKRLQDIADARSYEYLCGPEIVSLLDEEESIMADIIVWIRNRNRGKGKGVGLVEARRLDTWAGPKGYQDRKLVWHPRGPEACDCGIPYGDCWKEIPRKSDPGTKYKRGKIDFQPFMYKDHCRSRQHSAFLVKHRQLYVFKMINIPYLALMVGAIQKCEVPFLLKSRVPLISQFARDYLSGVWGSNLVSEENLENSTPSRYEIPEEII